MGFLTDAEGRTLPGVAVRSHVAGNGPSGVGKPLQQPAGVTPSRRSLHNQTDSAARHALALLHPGSHQLPVTVVSGGGPNNANAHAARVLPFDSARFIPNGEREADKCNEIQNLRAITEGGQSRGAAICNHF